MSAAIDLTMAQVAQYEVEVAIEAARDRVWEALTNEIAAWWPEDFHTLPMARMTLEPRVGGRMYEDADDGAGRQWYSVLTYMPPDELELAGHLMPAFGGPGTTLLRITLAQTGGRTVVKLADALVGRLTAEGVAELRDGWATLLAALKAHLEA